MSRWKKVAAGCIWVVGILVGSVAVLEILSRTCDCSPAGISASVPACDQYLYVDDANLKSYLNELSRKYEQGISPTSDELQKAVIEVTRDSIGGGNGVYCNGVVFVGNDLPEQAELYVRRHEMEHAFQDILQMDAENWESAANYAAAKEYPIGMIETVIISVIEASNYFSSPACFLIAIWAAFKIYFLPFAG